MTEENNDKNISDNEKNLKVYIDENNVNNHEYSFEEALNLIGFGKVHIIITLVSGIMLMAVINETMGMMIIGISSQCDLDMNLQKKGLLAGISYIGIILSSHIWGYLADTIGRRKVVMYSMFACNILTFLSSLIENYWVFLIFRLLSGIFISGPSATIYAYLGEFHNMKYRPITISFASVFVGVATVYIPVIAWLILPSNWEIPIYDDFSFRPWRLLLSLYTLPGLIGALCLIKLPETPKFSLSQNREDEALKTLEWIYNINNKNRKEEFPIKKLLKENDVKSKIIFKKSIFDIIKSMFYQTVPLFKKPYLTNFTICCVIQFGLFFCSSGIGLWYPEIKNRLSALSDDDPVPMCSVIDKYSEKFLSNRSETEIICNDEVNKETYIANIMLGSFFVIGYIILGFIINLIGRRIILPIVLFGSGISGFLLNWIIEPNGIVIIFAMFQTCAGLCVSLVNSAVVELTPTHLRGMAVCVALMVGRFGSVVGSNLIGALLEVNCTVTFLIFASYISFCAVIALLLP